MDPATLALIASIVGPTISGMFAPSPQQTQSFANSQVDPRNLLGGAENNLTQLMNHIQGQTFSLPDAVVQTPGGYSGRDLPIPIGLSGSFPNGGKGFMQNSNAPNPGGAPWFNLGGTGGDGLPDSGTAAGHNIANNGTTDGPVEQVGPGGPQVGLQPPKQGIQNASVGVQRRAVGPGYQTATPQDYQDALSHLQLLKGAA